MWRNFTFATFNHVVVFWTAPLGRQQIVEATK